MGKAAEIDLFATYIYERNIQSNAFHSRKLEDGMRMCRKMERPRGLHREANFSGTRGHVGSVSGGCNESVIRIPGPAILTSLTQRILLGLPNDIDRWKDSVVQKPQVV